MVVHHERLKSPKQREHPTVLAAKQRLSDRDGSSQEAEPIINAADLRSLCLGCGADDVAFVEFSRSAFDFERADVIRVFPAAKSYISFCVQMNREPIRTTARSVSNLEFHRTGEEVNDAGARIVAKLQELGVKAINPSMGFPMEMDNFPAKPWVVSHKVVAVEAGLGHMGIHRNVIHPKFGNFILLGTVITDAEISEYHRPIDYNPCLECKLCVVACPVGAISPDGHFNFSSCFNHNYREFMSGFTEWVERVVASKSPADYRRRVSDSESASMWQSLSFGANYKAAYCLSVCPAGEDVISPFLEDKQQFLKEIVRPLQDKEEPVYVVGGSDAETHVERKFPNKTARRINGSLRSRSIANFLKDVHLVFQREQSEGLSACYHFTFRGAERRKATIDIRDKLLEVRDGHVGRPDLRVIADSATWLGFVAKERSLVWALLRLKIIILGNPLLLIRFGKCFPS